MDGIGSMGKILLVTGLGIAGLGLLLMLVGRVPFLGNLPGDLSFERDNVKVYVPVATMVLVSIVLTVLVNVIYRLFARD
ncbi:MAG: DUF2905 domain-containing protein [Chloroflexota bacterium]